MAQTRGATFAAQADADRNSPVILVRPLLIAGGTKYWTSWGGTYDGHAYEELLSQGVTVTLGLDDFGRATRTLGDLLIVNEDDGAGSRPSDLLGTEIFLNAAVQVDATFVVPGCELFPVIRGILELPAENCFTDQFLHLQITDDGNPVPSHLLRLSPGRLHRVLGDRIRTADYPGADPDAVGLVKPIVYGRLESAPGYPVDAGAVDAVSGDMTNATTVVPLSDPTRFAQFPASGTVVIGDEEIAYTGKQTGGSILTTSSGATTFTDSRVTDGAAWDLSGVHVFDLVRSSGGKIGVVTAVNDASNYLDVAGWTGGTPTNGETVTVTGAFLLTGCTRAQGGTAAAPHVAGSECFEKKSSYTYLIAAHACKSLTKVWVDDVLWDPSTYTVDLSGPTTVIFNVKPTMQSLAITGQPAFSATVTAEQSPGGITTTSEKTPGAITTGSEQSPGSITHTSQQSPGGITTTSERSSYISSTGSHGHTDPSASHEYGTGTNVPGTMTGTTSVSFANTPRAGYSANIHVRVLVCSGTWHFRRGDGTTIISNVGANLASNIQDYYGTDGSPSTSYQFYMASAGSLVVAQVDRDVVITVSGDNAGASGISTGESGATATSMAALAGSDASSMAALAGSTTSSMASLNGNTASNMAALNGSTAVSVARTQNVAVSGADVKVGRKIRVEVEGYADDLAGTYTGTPSALITNPSDQIRHLLAVSLGLTLADWVDTTSFTAARAAYAAAGIRCDWGIFDVIDSADLLERIRWATASRLFLGAEGKFKLYLLPIGGASQKTFTEADDVLDDASGGGPIQVTKTTARELWNRVLVLHTKNLDRGDWPSFVMADDPTSQGGYRTLNALILENDFLRDATAAQAVADKLLAWHATQKWRISFTAWGTPALHLEPCDKIAVTSSRMPAGGWAAKAFYIESVTRALGRPGQVDAVTLTCREA